MHAVECHNMLARHVRRLSRAPRARDALGSFEARVASYWTPERVAHLTKNRDDMPLRPDKPGVAQLLRVLELIEPDGSISTRHHRKWHQLNSLYLTIERHLDAPLRRTASSPSPLRIVELCAGPTYLTLLIAFAARGWPRPAQILAVDADATRVRRAESNARALGFGRAEVAFRTCRASELREWEDEHAAAFGAAPPPPPPHAVFALHACDVATDEAIAYGVASEAESILVAPCCQAELAAKWKARTPGGGGAHAFGLIHKMPNLRREVGAQITDAMRVALLRASGYVVEAHEFVPSEHTPKNRLLLGRRRRRGGSARGVRNAAALPLAASGSGLDEYQALVAATGGEGIALAGFLGIQR